MSQDDLKKLAAEAALAFVKPGMVVGVGTGSTTQYFIEGLKAKKADIDAVVASSVATAEALKAQGFRVSELTAVGQVDLYVDGADEVDSHKRMIKGGGGALTREKILATVAKQFVCIVDESKKVDMLGAFPLAIEVLPMARSYVARELVKAGGFPVWREGFVTDNGNLILDDTQLDCKDAVNVESMLSQIVGVVESGLFAKRIADVVLVGTSSGLEQY